MAEWGEPRILCGEDTGATGRDGLGRHFLERDPRTHDLYGREWWLPPAICPRV